MLARTLRQGIDAGQIEPHDPDVLGAAITGALGEALVGPLAARRRSDALVASLVQFCLDAIPVKEPERSLAA
jgi:hypothetical protein